jgi:hypothetical protein
MPAANVAELRTKVDQFARAKLTLADFEPTLPLDGELNLTNVTPELFRALQLLEPYGIGNPEPVFAAHCVQLFAPPRILKDKHIKLKVKAGQELVQQSADRDSCELSAVAILATPRCHPDGAAIRRSDRSAAVAEAQSSLRTENREPRVDLRSKIVFDALGWHMAERLQQTPLLAGDSIDIAFSVGNNDHPDYGGLELSLRDFRAVTTSDNAHPAGPSPP